MTAENGTQLTIYYCSLMQEDGFCNFSGNKPPSGSEKAETPSYRYRCNQSPQLRQTDIICDTKDLKSEVLQYPPELRPN